MTPLPFQPGALRALCRFLAEEVHRGDLYTALIDARVVDKGTSREDLRRLCPDPESWSRRILEALDRPESRTQALRALRLITQSYTRLPQVDNRVETSVKKALVAAERNDPERLRREAGKLEELRRSETVKIPDTVGFLYLACTTDGARHAVEDLLAEDRHPDTAPPSEPEPEPESEPAPALLGEVPRPPPTAAPPAAPVAAVETRPGPPVVAPQEAPGRGWPVMAELREALAVLTGRPSASPPPAWDVESLRSSFPPAPNVVWPELDGLTSRFAEARAGLASILDLRPPSSAAEVPAFGEALQELEVHARALQELRAALDAYQQQAFRTIEPMLQSFTSLLGPEVLGLIPDPSSALFSEVVGGVESVGGRAHGAWLARQEAFLEGVRTLRFGLEWLPAAEGLRVWTEVRKAAADLDLAALARLDEQVAAEAQQRQQAGEATRKLVQDMLVHLDTVVMDAPSERRLARALRAIRENNLEDAQDFIVAASSHPPQAVRPTGPIALVVTPASVPPVVEPQTAWPAYPSLTVAVERFSPRDSRLKAAFDHQGRPSSATDLLRRLLDRARGELARRSAIGLLDNVLDMLAVAACDLPAGEWWASTALALLGALPYRPAANFDGRARAADVVRDCEADAHAALVHSFVGLIRDPDADRMMAERFSAPEFLPFAGAVAKGLRTALERDRAFFRLEDLARGIGSGLAFGKAEVVRALIAALARDEGLPAEQIEIIERAIDPKAPGAAGRAIEEDEARLPHWSREAIQAAANARDGLEAPARSQRVQKDLHLEVPRSIRKSGVPFQEGDETVPLALLVGNPKDSGRMASSTELFISGSRNRAWLAEDIVCSLGALPPHSGVLARALAPVAPGFKPGTTVSVAWELRFRDREARSARVLSGTIQSLKIGGVEPVTVDNYKGAGGEPLVLAGDAFERSSSSIRKALTDLLRALETGDGIAAVLIGRRRHGKTSILNTIMKHTDVRKRYVVVLNVREDLPFTRLGDALLQLASILEEGIRKIGVDAPSLREEIVAHPNEGWEAIKRWLDRIEGRLSQPARVLLLIDEFQKWLSKLDSESRLRLLGYFRGLRQRPERQYLEISIVISGLLNIRQYVQSSADFRNAFRTYHITAPKSEADELIRANTSIEFDTRAIDRIRELSGGNPFLINLLGQEIAVRLRSQDRAYCLPEDVDRVVGDELDDRQDSRVWAFLQYLLKEGEEDHAADIRELPALVALAWTLRRRGERRRMASLDEVADELDRAGVACDRDGLADQLNRASETELVEADGRRYGFASHWLALWLAAHNDGKPLPVRSGVDRNLVLGRYRIGARIAGGGQGTVYEAADARQFDRPVVVKIYPRSSSLDANSPVQREAQALSRIQHSGVVRCLDFGVDDEKGDVIVLDRAEGCTLRALMQDRPQYASPLIGSQGVLAVQVQFLSLLVAALDACHQGSVVHKDLKPENVMVSQEGGVWRPKIIDFGLADMIQGYGEVPTIGSYTPGYVAPERYRGEPRGKRADVYSLGVLAYELLADTGPFPVHPVEAQASQLQGRYVPLKEKRTDIPSRLSELIGHMLATEPQLRPETATLAAELPLVLSPTDWSVEAGKGDELYVDSDYEGAFEHLERALFSAGDAARTHPRYLEVLETFIDVCRRLGRLCAQGARLTQPVMEQVLAARTERIDIRTKLLDAFVSALLEAPSIEDVARLARLETLRRVVEVLGENRPSPLARDAVEGLVRSTDEPLLLQLHDDLFPVALEYRAAGLLAAGLVENWCVVKSRRLRERGEVTAAQVWLRRAERLGVANGDAYRAERGALDAALRMTANPARLPDLPISQLPPENVVGDDERGHLNVERIRKWAQRLYTLHPYVQEVRRVHKERGLGLFPTRLLDLSNLPSHLRNTPGLDAARVIPAVLDASHCRPAETVLRINVILCEGTTVAQREAAYDSLRSDGSVFPRD